MSKIDEIRKSIKKLHNQIASSVFILERTPRSAKPFPPTTAKLTCRVEDNGIAIEIDHSSLGGMFAEFELTDDEAIELYIWLHKLYVP